MRKYSMKINGQHAQVVADSDEVMYSSTDATAAAYVMVALQLQVAPAEVPEPARMPARASQWYIVEYGDDDDRRRLLVNAWDSESAGRAANTKPAVRASDSVNIELVEPLPKGKATVWTLVRGE